MQAQDSGESASQALAQLREARQELAQLREASQADADALQSSRSQLQVSSRECATCWLVPDCWLVPQCWLVLPLQAGWQSGCKYQHRPVCVKVELQAAPYAVSAGEQAATLVASSCLQSDKHCLVQAFREAAQQQAAELADQRKQLAVLQREKLDAQQQLQEQLQEVSSRRSTLEGSTASRGGTEDVSSQPADAAQARPTDTHMIALASLLAQAHASCSCRRCPPGAARWRAAPLPGVLLMMSPASKLMQHR